MGGLIYYINLTNIWGISSFGRALALQVKGGGFKSHMLHAVNGVET